MRLTRTGSKKRPSYRVIVADSRAPRDGRHVDILGHYDPMTTPSTVRIDVERAVQWLRNGAQPSERVRILLRHAGVLKAHEEARIADKRVRKEAEATQPKRPPRAPKPPAAKAATKTAPRSSQAAKSADGEGETAAKTTRARSSAKSEAPAGGAASKRPRSRAASKTES